MRCGLFVALSLVAVGIPAAGQQPPELREELEVRELPLLVALPKALADREPGELRDRLIVIEDGVERGITAVAPVAPPGGAGFTRTVVAVDGLHCDSASAAAGASALARQAGALAALGPVWTARLGRDPVEAESLPGGADALASALVGLVGRSCTGAQAVGSPSIEGLACPGPPCLLVWLGSGWKLEERTAERSLDQAGALARSLASSGWTVLVVAPEPAAAGAEPQQPAEGGRPGDDRTSWTVNVLDKEPGSAGRKQDSGYGAAVDLSLAPLRRLASATGGELAAGGAAVEAAVSALGRRSLLYYRTDRDPGLEAAPISVVTTDQPPVHLRAPEWAPLATAAGGGARH